MDIPKLKGEKVFDDIDISTVVPYIDWVFFFKAWGLPGRFDGMDNFCGCEQCIQNFLIKNRKYGVDKAREALNLYQDARQTLQKAKSEKSLTIKAKIMFCPAHSENEGIVISPEGQAEIYLPMLRQQHPGELSGKCVSIADFISPKSDFIGLFSLCIDGADAQSELYKKKNDLYNSILIKSVADRLAEATAEWLHQQVRTTYWGYAPDEHYTPEELMKKPYDGIRPAIGYPSIPDQRIIFKTNQLLRMEEIGISITENGAMQPNASISGLYISHPKSFYFMVGKVGDDQLEDYARRSGSKKEDLSKWLMHNL